MYFVALFYKSDQWLKKIYMLKLIANSFKSGSRGGG